MANKPKYVANKDPDETLDNLIDFSARLVDLTIVLADAVVIDGLTVESVEIASGAKGVIVRVSGGVLDTVGSVTVRVNVSDGQIFDQTMKMKIRSK